MSRIGKREPIGNGSTVRSGFENILENLFVAVLALYPLRHINLGLDLWDVGYNYANFQYMGTEHMDSMWLFSTYLSNAVGNLIMRLPNAGSLLGMNLYTGLFVSFLALTGFFFCYRVLRIPLWISFVGEFLAISLCWCPTAKLYDYLTYVFLLCCVVLLYHGLTKEKKWCLFLAGICLGANVLVRFSNLPEAALILAVWAYDFIVWSEDRKVSAEKQEKGQFWPRLGGHTLWCVAGYLAALGVLFLHIQIRYGMDQYVAGIRRLFAMTDNATDYKAASMLFGVIRTYVDYLYWIVRIGVILAGGMALIYVWERLRGRLDRLMKRFGKHSEAGEWVFAGLLGAATAGWLYFREFCSFFFYSYDSMVRPGILFLMLTMLVAFIRIFHPKCPKEEKLVSGLVLLLVLITSIGSNNGVYPSLNNLFVAAPYTLWQAVRFLRNTGRVYVGKIQISSAPIKGVLTAFLLMCLFQFGLFGVHFVFAEGTGVRYADSYVENNEILRNIRMSQDKALWLGQISAYAEENDLRGHEVILYGGIPALSYYLQMPSAFNPWSDLDSYDVEQMALKLEETAVRMARTGERPVIIVESGYAERADGGAGGSAETPKNRKWILLLQFMEEQGYEQDFDNGKFVIFR